MSVDLDEPVIGKAVRVQVAFAHSRHAERLVAGVPAAARAVREVHLAGFPSCRIVAEAGWQPGSRLRAELARLAPGCDVTFGFAAEAPPDGAATLVLDGVALPAADAIARLHATGDRSDWGSTTTGAHAPLPAAGCDPDARLAAAAVAIVHATGKAGDGIVSRSINRPISRAISTALLRIPGIRPSHATLGTGLLAAAMFAALLTGTRSGQIWGALLFQAASIFDGVDGEIARATFHTSRFGAMLDSLIDAATNLAFILGLAINLAILGHWRFAEIGFAGLALLGCGLVLIGRESARRGGPFTFDVIKQHYRDRAGGRPSPLVRAVTFVTSRDFFALLFAVSIVVGLAGPMVIVFAVAALVWFAAVVRAITAARA